MLKTTNYGLNKPELQDSPPDITVLNPNFDKIDTELKKNADSASSANANAETRLPKTGGNVSGNLTVQDENIVRKVNGQTANEKGELEIDVGGDVRSVNGVRPDESGNVEIKAGVVSVNKVLPDEETGDIDLGERIKDASSRTDILEAFTKIGLDGKTLQQVVNIILNTYVKSVNGLNGDVTIDLSKYLPLSGGTMTGTLVNTLGDLIKQNATNKWTSIKGGTSDETGAYFTAYGKDHANNGRAVIGARNDSDVSILELTPLGFLYLNNNQIPTLRNPFVPDYSAGVAISSGYVTPSSGVVIIQTAGSAEIATTLWVNGVNVGFHKTTSDMDSTVNAWVNKNSTITFKVGGSASSAYFFPLAVGG